MWNELDKIRKKYYKLQIDESVDYRKFATISIIYHSTKIEGCSLTENDTGVLLDKGLTAKGKPLDDHLMVKDHYNAFNFIFNQAEIKRKLSPEFLREVSALVMKSTGGEIKTMGGNFNSAKGDFRLAQVYVERKYFPDFKKVPGLVVKLCDEVNLRIDKVEGNEVLKLAADIHFNLVNIHPFADGNGRLARLFMNYVQLYHNNPLVKIFSEDRADYIDALNHAETESNPEIFREFICIQQIKFLKSEISKFEKKGTNFKLLF